MSSKGVNLYTFSSEGFMLTGTKKYKGDHSSYSYGENYVYKKDPYQLDWHRLSIEAKTSDGRVLFERSIEDRGFTSGDVDLPDRLNMFQGSKITPEYCFTFGMFYSHRGLIENFVDLFKDMKLSDHHEIYAVITENQSRWMEKLFSKYAQSLSDISLSNLVLPGAHDAGMYGSVGHVAIWADTQKDSIADQLQLGVRIFDIRPGMSISGKLCHIHGFRVAAGEEYDSMFRQIADFLVKNTKEIVVVHICDDGVPNGIMVSGTELEARINKLLNDYPSITVGNANYLQASVGEILSGETQPRLIVVSKDYTIYDKKIDIFSSYWNTGANYSSLESKNIQIALDDTKRKDWSIVVNKGKPDEYTKHADITEVSLQLTATNVSKFSNVMSEISTDVVIPDMSPLISTKGAADLVSYNWLHQNDFSDKPLDSLVALYNDYVDGGLTVIASKQSEKRIAARLREIS